MAARQRAVKQPSARRTGVEPLGYHRRPMDREHLLKRAVLLSVASIGISALVGTAAVVVALATESLSLLGFGADAVIDSAASVVLVWRFRTEVREPHRADRIEEVAERLVGGVLLILA